MATLRERAEKAERRIEHAEACMFEMAVHDTIEARRYEAKYGEFDRTVALYEQSTRAHIGGLWFLSERSDDQLRDEIRARVETAADERIAAKAGELPT